MGFDNDCILDISSLAGEYFCAICRTLVYPNEALQASCTHLYCKPCLTYVVSTTNACPYDGYRVTEADSKPLVDSNKALADTIGNIQVHCLYYRTGCTWQGSLSDCVSHCSTCAFGESAVLCNRCGVQIKHRQVQEHAPVCPGVQSQAQQTGAVQDSTSTGGGASSDQAQTAAQTVAAASQAQKSEASAPIVSGQDANQTANSATQPQAAQAAMPTQEQWYQQQQQYQQYYQQYPGYDPYQQGYQYYYQYPQAAQQYPQAAQQYPQQQMQTYPTQAYGQVQSQTQTQTQPQIQVQPPAQPQLHQQPPVPLQGVQAPVQPQAQPAVNVQPQVLATTGQAQPQTQTQTQGQAPPSHALPYNQPQPHVQPQPYVHPQPVPQQHIQVPQYQQTHPQVQHPHAQPYPQSQTHYSQSQPQTQLQPHSQPNLQAPAHLPPQQPVQQGTQLQTPNAVTGFQSYPQSQGHTQLQAGAAHPMQQAQYPNQMQGQFHSQVAQMRPPQPYPNMPSQQQPATLPAQVQLPSGASALQLPSYPHAQQPGYPFQPRPAGQAAQHAAPQHYAQQQSFPGQGPYMQPQPMTPQLHPQGTSQKLQQSQQNYAPPHGAQPNPTQNYAGRPMAPPAGAQPYGQTTGIGGTGQVRPQHLNQGYPMKTDNQVTSGAAAAAAERHTSHSQGASSGEKPRDQMHDKDPVKESRDMTGTSSGKSMVNEMKSKSESSLSGIKDEESKNEFQGSKQVADADAQEGKPSTKGDAAEGTLEPSSGGNATRNGTVGSNDVHKKAEVQDLKHMANGAGPQSNLNSQVQGTNSFPPSNQGRNPLQPMAFGSSAQHRPGPPTTSQSVAHPVKSQQPALLGHPPNQLRPQGPGQAPAGLPFNAGLKHPPGGFPSENSSGGILGPGASAHFGRPGNIPPHQTGPHQNLQGDPFVGSSFAAQQQGAFDSRAAMGGREPTNRLDLEQRPPYPSEAQRLGVQSGAMKFGGLPAHDAMPAPGMRDDRAKLFPEDHLKHFPHREFDDGMPKFPRPAHLDAGPSSNYGSHFPASAPLDHGSRMFGENGMQRPFVKGPHGFDRDPAAGPSRFLPPVHPDDVGERGRAFPDDDMMRADLGHHPDFSGPAPGPGFGCRRMDGLPCRSPGRDYGFPSRPFAPYGDIGGNESRSFENRFPGPPRGDLDLPGNLRMGERMAIGSHDHDMLPSHLQRVERMGPRGLHLEEAAAFGPPGRLSRMGEPPLGGNFPPHIPFGDVFGGEKLGHPMLGEPGFRSGFGFQRFPHDGGFFPGEMDPFDNPRKRKPGSIMCRICNVECGSVEGLDMHSQSREHQRKARDMVLSIKQQNKKQKLSKDQASVEEGRDGGRNKNPRFQGRGNKR